MRAARKVLKASAIAAGALILLLALIAGFTQTRFFRDRLRAIVASAISTRLNGSLHLGALDGNLITGFTIDSLAIESGDETILSTRKIAVRYEPSGFFRKHLTLEYCIIEQPVLHAVRPAGGDWNFRTIVKPDTSATSAGPFDWVVALGDIELKNATLTVNDSGALAEPGHWSLPASFFEYHDFSVNDLNLKMSASMEPGRGGVPGSMSARILHASCYSPQSRFELTHFAGTIGFSNKGLSIGNAIIQTGKSYIELDAALRGFDPGKPFRLEELGHDSARIQMRARNLDLGELRSFLPQVQFLDGSVFLDLDASGEFGNLLIKHLHLASLGTTINCSGNVRNLHRPHDLTNDVLIGDTRIDPADAARLLPGLHIPAFTGAGPATVFAEFNGRPLNFKVKTIVRGAFGTADVNGELNLERGRPAYRGLFTTNRLNLGTLVGDRNIRTSLNATGNIAGQGFHITDITGTLGVSLDSSRVQGLSLATSTVTVEASPRKVSANVKFHGAGNAAAMTADVHAEGDFTDAKRPHYVAAASLGSFDLAQILDDDTYASSLTLHGTASASGTTIDDLDAEGDISVLPSVFQGHQVDRQDIHLALDQRSPSAKRLSLRSGIADVDFNGRFDLDLHPAAIAHQAQHLLQTIRQHALPADSVRAGSALPPLAVRQHSASERRIDCTYSVAVKDLEPLADLIKGSPFDANAHLSGSVAGTADSLSLTCKGTFGEFYFGTVRGGVLLDDASVNLSLSSLSETQTLERLTARGTLEARSGSFSMKPATNIHVNLGYANLAGDFRASAVVDSFLIIHAKGTASVQPHTYVFDLDTLTLDASGYAWKNEQDVQCRWDFDGFRIMRGTMKRGSESVSLTGILRSGGGYDVSAAARNCNLEAINTLTRNPELAQPGQGFSGTADADLHLTGTAEAPLLNFTAVTAKARFRETRIGTLTARVDYANRLASLDVSIRELPSDSTPSLSIKGTLPIDLGLSGVTERFPDAPEHIEIVSTGFDVAILDPLLADFDNISGSIRANVILLGTPRAPRYSGSIALADIRFLFRPNNLEYTVAGHLEPNGEKIVVPDLTIKSTASGRRGDATVTGSVAMKNFQLGDFDLLVNGRVLLMSEATRKRIPTMYGILLTETDGLSITGNIGQPVLAGTLRILDADLIFPPATGAAAGGPNMALPVMLIDDTSKSVQREERVSKFYGTADAQALPAVGPPSGKTASPLLDRIRYNLVVETRGITAVKMIFTPATGEQLYAELEGKVTAINNSGTPTIYGEIEVAQRSYYTFFKKFDATGKLRFVGPWDNPELDIKATYDGVRQITESIDPGNGSQPETRTTDQNVRVLLTISGTRFNPRLVMGMQVQDRPGAEYVDWSEKAGGGDVQGDVISFIVTGKFRDQLTSKEQQQIANVGSSTGSSVASNLASGILSDYLRQEFSFIRSVDVNYQGGNFQEGTNVNISTAAPAGQLRIGGKVFNDLGNASLTYQVNLMRNLYLEFQRKVTNENTEDKRLTNEARIYYRFAF